MNEKERLLFTSFIAAERMAHDPEFVFQIGRRHPTIEKDRQLKYYRASDCKSCTLRSQCTRNKYNRAITREASEHLMEEMAARVRKNRDIMKSRKALVEHPFGTIKRGMGMGYFLCKGLKSVRAEIV